MQSSIVFQPQKFAFFLALFSFLSLSIGSANRPELTKIDIAAYSSIQPTLKIATQTYRFFYPEELLSTNKPALLTNFSEKKLRLRFQ